MPLLAALSLSGPLTEFEPTPAAAHARLARLNPARYARTRNHLDGAVSGLSPYITHGLLSVQGALAALAARTPLSYQDKIVAEFAWREFFAHVWQREGDGILADLGAAPWGGDYARVLPPDVRSARTGVPAIDSAVRTLYATGYLHNHARMWLASYVVHYRKVHWRVAADWMVGHLLDGDLASNHLSWQWVAGTFSTKPYVFNAENVARYAPASGAEAWLSEGSAIDRPYDALDALARSAQTLQPDRASGAGTVEPPLLGRPPGSTPFDGVALDGKAVELVHPWALHDAPRGGASALRLGVVHLPFHQAFPWSARRWQFVLTRLQAITGAVYVGDLAQLAPALQRSADVRATATLNPHYRDVLGRLAKLTPAPRLFHTSVPCTSFTKFYDRVQRDAGPLAALLQTTPSA